MDERQLGGDRGLRDLVIKQKVTMQKNAIPIDPYAKLNVVATVATVSRLPGQVDCNLRFAHLLHPARSLLRRPNATRIHFIASYLAFRVRRKYYNQFNQ